MLGSLASLPAFAARPLLDRHQWDAYFALFARDVYVPWKPATVTLDTYSGAPVDFAAYNVDPAEVVIAGTNPRVRSILRVCARSCDGAFHRRRGIVSRPATFPCRSARRKVST